MATFSLKSRSLFARNCILATNKQFTKSPLQQAADRYLPAYQTYVQILPSISQVSKKPAFCISEQLSVNKIWSIGFLKSS